MGAAVSRVRSRGGVHGRGRLGQRGDAIGRHLGLRHSLWSQMEPGCLPRQHLARGRSGAVPHQQPRVAAGGLRPLPRWLGERAEVSGQKSARDAIVGSAPWLPAGRTRTPWRGATEVEAAGVAPASSLAREVARKGEPPTPDRSTGAGACRGSETPMQPSSCSAWLRRPTGRIAPGACSPGTARATGSSPPCTRPDSPLSHQHVGRRRVEAAEAYITATVHCAPPDNKPTPEERATCPPTWPGSSHS